MQNLNQILAFNVNRKIVDPTAQKTKVIIEGYKFVNPSDIFMLVVPSNSTIIPINNNIHFILAPLVFHVIYDRFLCLLIFLLFITYS